MNQQNDDMSVEGLAPKRQNSELRRAILRMSTNYIRLFISVFIGLMLVRIILSHWGNDAWALIALLGGTLGIAAMLQDIVRQSMIRELASAHHSKDRDLFLGMYNSSLLVTFCIGVITFLVVMLIAAILPLFEIPPDLLTVARWLVIAKGIETVIAIWVGAPMNMYIATERMALSNLWIVAQRACPIIAVLWIIKVEGTLDPVEGLKSYAVLSATLFICVSLFATALMMVLDRRMIPRLTRITKATMRELLRVGGWNAVAVTSLGMHIRIDAILMNLFMGLGGSLIYGFTSQLTSYVRMLGMGVSYGLDAVTTRISTHKGENAVTTLCHHITRLNSCIAFPSAAALFVLAEPILYLWIGDRMDDPETQLPLTVVMIRIMTIGMVIRAMTDGWIKILYGAGHVSRYAPIILGAVIANPILAIALYFILPESTRFTFAVTSYTTVYIIFNIGFLPKLMGKLLDTSIAGILSPTVKPLIATFISVGALVYMTTWIDKWNGINFIGVSIAYGIIYAVLLLCFVLNSDERRLIFKALRK